MKQAFEAITLSSRMRDTAGKEVPGDYAVRRNSDKAVVSTHTSWELAETTAASFNERSA